MLEHGNIAHFQALTRRGKGAGEIQFVTEGGAISEASIGTKTRSVSETFLTLE